MGSIMITILPISYVPLKGQELLMLEICVNLDALKYP